MSSLDYLPLFGGAAELTDVAKIHVNVKPVPYEIIVAEGVISHIDQIWKNLHLSSQILIVSDTVVFDLYGKKLLANFNYRGIQPIVHLIPQGESSKCNEQLCLIYDDLVANKFSRDSVIIAFGGGVVGDLAGYAAATYMRGINLVQIPTTLLAQVDSSIGGKTAINHEKGKNLIGAFYQPRVVIVDISVLATLPIRELRTGMAEVIKYGVIDDPAFFSLLELNKAKLLEYNQENKQLWINIIISSCRVKAKVVTIDERENGLRAILNFGHTIAHGIETITDYTKYNHGEAVSIGMVGAAIIARNRGLVADDVVNRIILLSRQQGLPVGFDSHNPEDVLELVRLDKKAKAGRISFVLPKKIGMVEIFSDISDNEIITALKELRNIK